VRIWRVATGLQTATAESVGAQGDITNDRGFAAAEGMPVLLLDDCLDHPAPDGVGG